MSSLDYLDLCRLCLVKDRVSVPIFEDEGDVRQIFLKITACLPVKVSRDDKLPKKICDDCVYKVELFYQFWNTTASAEKQLLQWLGEVGGLEDKQGYVTEVLDTNVMKQERNSDNRLDGSVLQVSGHQNSMDMGMMDNISLITMPAGNEQQFAPVPIDTSGTVQTVQAVPGPSTQNTHDAMTQSQTSVSHLVEEEEESEEDENSDDGCDNEEGLPVKEETEDDQTDRPLEPTTFVSLPCDEAGPSGLQQQKISEISEMTMSQTTDGDPKTGHPVKLGRRFVFQKRLVKVKPWQVINSRAKMYRAAAAAISNPSVHAKAEPSDVLLSNEFEEVLIDGSESEPTSTSTSSSAITGILEAAQDNSRRVIVYMCKACKMYFPVKRMLEAHNASIHGKVEEQREQEEEELVEEQPSDEGGYHKLAGGGYACNSCSFQSMARAILSSHVRRKHAQAGTVTTNETDQQIHLLVLQEPKNEEEEVEEVEEVEKHDQEHQEEEDFWPMEVVEEEIEEEEDKQQPEVASPPANRSKNLFDTGEKTRSCPYCPFETSKSSTFHSHVKRRHREKWLKSIAQKVAALQPVRTASITELSCSYCSFKAVKRSTMIAHVQRKHNGVNTNPLEIQPEVKQEDVDNEEEEEEQEQQGQEQEREQGQEQEQEQEREQEQEIIEEHIEDADAIKDEIALVEEVVETEPEQQDTRRPRKCPYCPFESAVSSTLNSHVTRRHRDQQRASSSRRGNYESSQLSGRRQPNAQLCTGYACHYCTFVAATIASINSHTSREHPGHKQPIKEVPVNEYDCDQCDYKSRVRKNMQLHVKRCHTTQANAEGMFACHVCSYETLSRMGLQRHVSIKHNKRRDSSSQISVCYQCNECDFKCYNAKMMDWHKRQHSARPNAEDDGNSYFCNDCDFSTWTKGQLYSHIKRKHKDTESRDPEAEQIEHVFACEQCDYTSKNKHLIKVHVIRRHTNEYNHECEICGKKYKVKADLTNHIRFQHREQPIICDVCGKTCRNSNLLYLHQKFAHYKPEFECPICHRRMVSQANLDDHIIKQHEQREDVVCEECGKTFTRQARLKIHMRIHTGVKPYTCKVCLKAFARKNGLRQHLLIHTGQRPYICDICGKSFTQKTGLICHRKSHPGTHPPLPRVTIDHVLSDLLNEES